MKNTAGERRWLVMSMDNPFRALVIPPKLDRREGRVPGAAWSPFDGYVRKARPEEDRDWPHKPDHDIGFAVHEPCDNTKMTMWSICHLSHHAAEGADHLHTIGRSIQFDVPRVRAPLPHERRRVTIKGHFDITDVRAFKNKSSHKDFTEHAHVDPNVVRAAIVLEAQSVGDMTADVLIKLKFNDDASVEVHTLARLFDDGDQVASVDKTFNVLGDAAVKVTGHLVDKHLFDADTGDFELHFLNEQRN